MYCSLALGKGTPAFVKSLPKILGHGAGYGQSVELCSYFYQLALLYSNALNPEEFGCVARPLVSTVWRDLKTPPA